MKELRDLFLMTAQNNNDERIQSEQNGNTRNEGRKKPRETCNVRIARNHSVPDWSIFGRENWRTNSALDHFYMPSRAENKTHN